MECPFLKGKPEQDSKEDFAICLNCPLYPLPCVHDCEIKGSKIECRGAKSIAKAQRNIRIKELAKVKTTRELAEEFNLSERTIQWITQKNARKVA